jgi:hypothetical protein
VKGQVGFQARARAGAACRGMECVAYGSQGCEVPMTRPPRSLLRQPHRYVLPPLPSGTWIDLVGAFIGAKHQTALGKARQSSSSRTSSGCHHVAARCVFHMLHPNLPVQTRP